jgi:hypothetical protein
MAKMIQIKKARQLIKQLGVKCAAGYLRNRGWSVEAAVFILCGK